MSSRLTAHVRANVVAYLALFVALGGTSYAAIRLPANSVGTKQIKTGAVRASDVQDGSLLATDFRAGQLPAGAPGAPGAPGARGATGPAGPGATKLLFNVPTPGPGPFGAGDTTTSL